MTEATTSMQRIQRISRSLLSPTISARFQIDAVSWGLAMLCSTIVILVQVAQGREGRVGA